MNFRIVLISSVIVSVWESLEITTYIRYNIIYRNDSRLFFRSITKLPMKCRNTCRSTLLISGAQRPLTCTPYSVRIVRKRFKVIVYNFIYLIQTGKNRMRGVQNHYFCMSLFLNYQPFFIRFCC